jgi:hypothetical protein
LPTPPVVQVEREDGEVVEKTEDGATVRAKHAVVATNSPINDAMHFTPNRRPTAHSTAMALELRGAQLPDGLYWDMLDPYHYVRPHPGAAHDYLIAGRRRSKRARRRRRDPLRALEAWIRNLMPNLAGVTHRWSGRFWTRSTIRLSAAAIRQQERLRAYRRLRSGYHARCRGSLIIASMIMQGREAVAGALRSGAQDCGAPLSTFISENVTAVKNFAEYAAPGEVGSFARSNGQPSRERAARSVRQG